MPEKILRLPKVTECTGLSRSAIYMRIEAGTFPKQIYLGPRAVGWLERDVDQWIKSQAQRSRGEHPTKVC